MYQDDEDRRTRRQRRFATASIVFAVISLFFLLVFYISIPCGAIAFLLAMFSRNRGGRMTGKAKTGAVIGIICAVLSFSVTAYSFHVLSTNPEIRRQVQYMVNQYAAASGLDYRFEDVFGGDPLPVAPDGTVEDVPSGQEKEYYNSSSFWNDLMQGKDVSELLPEKEKNDDTNEEIPVPEMSPEQDGSFL